MKRRIMWCLALGLAGCGAEGGATAEQDPAQKDGQEVVASPSEEIGSSEAEIHGPAPKFKGWMTEGFCRELADALGRPVAPSSWASLDIPGVISCFQGYGVDGISLFGSVSAGVGSFGDSAQSPTALVNGRTVGVMSVVLTGAEADSLMNAVPLTMYKHSWKSAQGRIECARGPGSNSSPYGPVAHCTLHGLVGFSL